jgi:hypothetical protein
LISAAIAFSFSVARDQHVGWPKRPGANASGGVPTIIRISEQRWWVRRKSAFAHPAAEETSIFLSLGSGWYRRA